ncbi:uncharacterized protein B0J16DRAFT_241459, partial [Fusarium flagelliforme]|uniref:uncharacterized protein n=1 Tax=Fusarium flagelliforme TaxID=2675880 RepID=UPI001E8EF0CC
IPNFQINDDSQIEITAHEDNLTTALTHNDFSGQSTDGSVSAGAYGVSVGVSAGHGSNNDTTTGNQTGTKNKTLFARYLLPRCDIVLWPDELEPMPELARLIEAIHQTKNIKMLQRLHAEYGNYFSQRVTLGGRLLSSKVLAANDSQGLDQQKQSFRTSVGTSVSGNVGIYNASVSASQEVTTGNAHTNENSSQTQNEACVFEAVGGNTILSTNPKAWCPTVADYKLWRVINRGDLLPLSQILSGIPGFEAVPSWFVRAVPALNRYITLDQDHGCKARFRVMSPTDSSNGNASYYLGHNPNLPVTPQPNKPYLTGTFQPDTYQAPAILGYEDFKDGKANFATEYNAQFVMTEWSIIAPFDKELKNGTRVILRSCFQESDKNKDPTPIHMVVFRSVPGEFVPAMSDSSDYQYWRILKTDAGERHIKPGDNIRLCWDFRDQTAGWRDFTEDGFGRREVRRPSDVLNPLFIKVPWLRYNASEIDGPLLMSAEREDHAERDIKFHIDGTDGVLPCRLQHLQLRIDSVGNAGRGDTEDYLLTAV